MDMPVDYHVWGAAGTLSYAHAKADQHHAELNDRFVDAYRIICLTSLLIRQLYHFCNRFRSWVAATGGQ